MGRIKVSEGKVMCLPPALSSNSWPHHMISVCGIRTPGWALAPPPACFVKVRMPQGSAYTALRVYPRGTLKLRTRVTALSPHPKLTRKLQMHSINSKSPTWHSDMFGHNVKGIHHHLGKFTIFFTSPQVKQLSLTFLQFIQPGLTV